jgi:hypothetical protein
MNHPQHGQPWHSQDQTYHLAPPPAPEKRRRRWPWVLLGVPIIAAGKYKTTGPDGPNCYYAGLKTGDGSMGDILDNNNSNGPVTVAIKESDGYFETQGCADWARAE